MPEIKDPWQILTDVCHIGLKSFLKKHSYFFTLVFFCLVHSIFRFLVKVTKNEKISCPVYFLYTKSEFCLKMTADFFVFWSFWPKNKKWNEPGNKHKNIFEADSKILKWNFLWKHDCIKLAISMYFFINNFTPFCQCSVVVQLGRHLLIHFLWSFSPSLTPRGLSASCISVSK